MKTIQKNSLFSAILLSGAVLLGAATHAKADVNISIGDPFLIPFPFLSFQEKWYRKFGQALKWNFCYH